MFDPTGASVLRVVNYQAKRFLASIEASMRSFNATLYTVLRAVLYDVAKLIPVIKPIIFISSNVPYSADSYKL